MEDETSVTYESPNQLKSLDLFRDQLAIVPEAIDAGDSEG